jgi:hypothetical protein
MSADEIAEAINDYWGPRCPEFNADCQTCKAWTRYDILRAARADALEEAARVADEIASTTDFTDGQIDGQRIAAAIRALKGPTA